MMRDPHPFARFINILGRGKSLTRSLTVEEAEEAMGMILGGRGSPRATRRLPHAAPGQGGKRRRRSRASSARPARALTPPPGAPSRRPRLVVLCRQKPAIAVVHPLGAGPGAERLARVHARRGGAHGGADLHGRGPARARHSGLRQLSKRPARRLNADNFAYLPIDVSEPADRRHAGPAPDPGPALARPHVRAHAQSFRGARYASGRLPSRLHAHPPRRGPVLGQPRLAVFRGEGGEIERRPSKPCDVMMAIDGAALDERWPPMIDEPRQPPDDVDGPFAARCPLARRRSTTNTARPRSSARSRSPCGRSARRDTRRRRGAGANAVGARERTRLAAAA